MRKLTLTGLTLLGAVHCGDSSTPDASVADVTDASLPDVTIDMVVADMTTDMTVTDSSLDRPQTDAAGDTTADVPPVDVTADAVADVVTDVASDASTDAALADGSTPRCESAGGRCVALVPGSCADGIVGNAEWFSCGGGDGVMCCLPTTTPPSCRAIGSRSEGWYRANAVLICYARCEGANLICTNIGTRSEGWYTDVATAACSDPPVERLVRWERCSP